jgi:hypothetical protein
VVGSCVANGASDIDFYKFTASDEGISLSHPIGCKRQTDFVLDNDDMELCVFAACQNGAADGVKGCKAGTAATNSFNMAGCCVQGKGQAIPDISCASVTKDDSAAFILRARQINTSQCLPYKVRYRF